MKKLSTSQQLDVRTSSYRRTKDVSNEMMEWYWPDQVDLPGYAPNGDVEIENIRDAVKLINAAKTRHLPGRST